MIYLRCIYCIAEIMPRAVFNKCDQVLIVSIRPGSQFLIKNIADHPNQVNVLPFIVTSDVIGLTGFSLIECNFQCIIMIMNEQPVAYIFSLTIHRYFLMGNSFSDHNGYQFFVMLMWPVII